MKLTVIAVVASLGMYLFASDFKEAEPVYAIIEGNTEIKLVANLSKEVKETSGLAYVDNLLITHNDSGNENILYALNKQNGKIENSFRVSDATNIDWEDLAQNEKYIFVGDIGNNDGNRKDLKIYIIKKENLKNKEAKSIKVDGVIEYHYADQRNFNAKKHNVDSEALIYFNEHLYLFSKNRESTLCKLYKIPSKPGAFTAEIVESIDIPGRVTGAAISPSNSKIILTAYNKDSDCFLYTLENFKEDRFFSGKNTIINLGPYEKIGQLEGVVFEDENNIFLSSEKTKNQKPNLYKLRL